MVWDGWHSGVHIPATVNPPKGSHPLCWGPRGSVSGLWDGQPHYPGQPEQPVATVAEGYTLCHRGLRGQISQPHQSRVARPLWQAKDSVDEEGTQGTTFTSTTACG